MLSALFGFVDINLRRFMQCRKIMRKGQIGSSSGGLFLQLNSQRGNFSTKEAFR